MAKNFQRRRTLLICAGLATAIAAVYWPVIRYDFVSFDDMVYVTDNPHVRAGMSGESILWAFTTYEAQFWHPLTWLSHMLDCQVFGMNAGGHHLVNLLFHLANTLLLFVALRRMTGEEWRSAIVAGLFALHPLHVESVAWVAERKDVLSTFFWMLTLWAYGHYVAQGPMRNAQPASRDGRSRATPPAIRQRRSWSPAAQSSTLYYCSALVFFGLGLMSKPMVVTLPFVLLLLDYWPLGRFERSAQDSKRRIFWSLVWEKGGFFVLALMASAVAFVAQKSSGGLSSLAELPMGARVGNALVSYLSYLWKTFWPAHLAVYYPHPGVWPWWHVAGALCGLGGLTIIVIGSMRKRPYGFVGWFWYVGTLLPVIGLVQVGTHAMADRYTYIPLIGVFVTVVWGVSELLMLWREGKGLLILASGLTLAGCMVLAGFQVKLWRNGETLFRHALAMTTDNCLAQGALGTILLQTGKVSEAIEHLEEAVRLKSQDVMVYNNCGAAWLQRGDAEAAIRYLGQAIRIKPYYARAHFNLGMALHRLGKVTEAIDQYEQAVRLEPDFAQAHEDLGVVLEQVHRVPEAIVHFEQAARLKPNDLAIRLTLGNALAQQGDMAAAIEQYERAVHLKPEEAVARMNLGIALFRYGRRAEAVEQLQKAVMLNPDDAGAHSNLGSALLQLGKGTEAVEQFEHALRLRPADAEARNNLGAACLRLGEEFTVQGKWAEAIAPYERAIEMNPDNAQVHDALGVALSQVGRYAEAVRRAQRALELAKAAGQADQTQQIEQRLRLYQAGRPYHQE